MADHSELVAEAMSEDQLVDMWSDYPCLYDVRSAGHKNRDSREKAFKEIVDKLGQTGLFYLYLSFMFSILLFNLKRVL